MGQEPDDIRREIEQTRERMTQTVDAIAYRADVKTRAKESIVEKKEAVMAKAGDAVHRVVGAMPDMPSTPDVSMPGFVPDGEQVRQGARQAVSTAQANPVGLGIGAVAAGFLLGMVVPSTRVEDERMGDMSDQLKDQARDVGQQALEHGKQVVQETAQTASETMQEQGQQHGEELAETLRDSAREIGPSA
jgi:gas vesicle protein